MFLLASPVEIDTYIKWTTAPLTKCIYRYYNKMVNNIHQQMLNCMFKTHQTIQVRNQSNRNQTLIMTQVTQLFHQLQQQTAPVTSHSSTTTSTIAKNNKPNGILETNLNTLPATQTTRETVTAPSHEESTQETATLTTTTTTNSSSPKHNRKSYSARRKIKQNHTPDNCVNPNCYNCAANNIVNLSKFPLSKAQTIVLSKGLSFIPTTDNATPMEIMKDFNTFTNKAKQKLTRMMNPPGHQKQMIHTSRPENTDQTTTTII